MGASSSTTGVKKGGDDSRKHTKNVSEPWFSYIKNGIKTVEGRLNKGDFAKMKSGDVIHWTNSSNTDGFTATVVKINDYKTFKEYLEAEGLTRCLPGVKTIAKGVQIYRKYYTATDEKTYGVRAFTLRLVHPVV